MVLSPYGRTAAPFNDRESQKVKVNGAPNIRICRNPLKSQDFSIFISLRLTFISLCRGFISLRLALNSLRWAFHSLSAGPTAGRGEKVQFLATNALKTLRRLQKWAMLHLTFPPP